MKVKTILQFLILVAIGVLYYFYVSTPNHEAVTVLRVIDGDTIELESGIKVRLLGINTPEKNMQGYTLAKNFLSEIVADNVLYMERRGIDRYGRVLAYVHTKDENINAKILKNGYGHLYYYDKDKHYKKLQESEHFAQLNKRGIWQESNYSNCLTLISLDYYDKGNDVETLKLENNCEIEVTVTIKDDATHVYQETIPKGEYIKTLQNIFNDDGDSLYVWDTDGKLIIFYRYT